MTQELIIATGNVHKIREIREILSDDFPYELRTLSTFKEYSAPEETGESFAENAKLKALHAAKTLGKPALSDDSGLVVPALNGAPGIYSARYAGEDATERDNRIKLLKEMEGLEEEQRFAYFVCVIALAAPDGKVVVEEARCEGRILPGGRGSNGHGYDPLFAKHDYPCTFAELDEATKNRISHRRKALDKIRLHLETLCCVT